MAIALRAFSICSPRKLHSRDSKFISENRTNLLKRQWGRSFCLNSFHCLKLAGNMKSTKIEAASVLASLAGDKSKVVDFYILGEAKEGVDALQIRSVQESLWSLQYKIPGVVTAFIGTLSHWRCHNERQFNFAVVFRFSTEAAYRNFAQNEEFKNLLQSDICKSRLTLVIQQYVGNDLETIFRKGEVFEEGFDHVLVTQLYESQNAEDAVQFLSVLGDVATQSEIKSDATSLGTVLECSDTNFDGPLLVLATHLGTRQGVENWQSAPPLQQLWSENGNGLVKAEMSFAIRLDTDEL